MILMITFKLVAEIQCLKFTKTKAKITVIPGMIILTMKEVSGVN